MRSRRQPNLDARLGSRITAAIRLSVDAFRERRTLFLDAVAQRVTTKAPRRRARAGDSKNYRG